MLHILNTSPWILDGKNADPKHAEAEEPLGAPGVAQGRAEAVGPEKTGSDSRCRRGGVSAWENKESEMTLGILAWAMGGGGPRGGRNSEIWFWLAKDEMPKWICQVNYQVDELEFKAYFWFHLQHVKSL